MDREVLNSQTKAFRKLCIEYEDLYKKDKVARISYLFKFEDRGHRTVPRLLAIRRSTVCEMQLHSQWKYYLVLQLKNSVCFRTRFFCWLLAMLQKSEEKHRCFVKLCEHCSLTKYQSNSKHPKIKLKLETLHSTLHTMEPEIRWSVRVLFEMLEQLQLEAVFAWLSTLGGAHSALGDYFNKNAKIAWELSLKQFYIAIKIGEPALAAHCKLFMSISLMQRGYYHGASKIIRSVSRSIVNDKRLHERRLINCCKAAKVRLKYLRQEKKCEI